MSPKLRPWRHRCGAMAVTARLATADDTPVGASSRSCPPSTFRFTSPRSFAAAPPSRHNEDRSPSTAHFALRGNLVDARRTSHSSVSGTALFVLRWHRGSLVRRRWSLPTCRGWRERERETDKSTSGYSSRLALTTLESTEHSRLLFVGRSSVASRVSESVSPPRLLTARSIKETSSSGYSLLRKRARAATRSSLLLSEQHSSPREESRGNSSSGEKATRYEHNLTALEPLPSSFGCSWASSIMALSIKETSPSGYSLLRKRAQARLLALLCFYQNDTHHRERRAEATLYRDRRHSL